MSFGDTIAAIRAQGGLVYLPHPFDRLHAIPDPATLHRHLAEIDVLEVYNARLLFEAYNDEALRFARKYDLTMGAGSDAHVLQGVGTGALRMRAFDGPEEFLVSLRTAEILRRPKSLARTCSPSSGWPQAKERVARARHWMPRRPSDCRADRRDLREVPAEGDRRDQRARRRDRARGRRGASVPVLGSGHPLADVFLLKHGPQARGGAGGRRLLRARGPGAAEVAAAAARRPDGGLRDELPQVRAAATRRRRAPG